MRRSWIVIASAMCSMTVRAAPWRLPAGAATQPLCADHSCKGRIAVDRDGVPLGFTTPHGFGAADIQAMYDIDPTRGDGQTIAIVDAYGYVDLESDLAVYRTQYGLGDCTIASGCLTILNNAGETAPLLGDGDTGWIGETALDVQMVSAACPRCKIVVIQADGPGTGLELGQLVARQQAVDAISNSWGASEGPENLMSEGDYDNPGIGTFVSTGDNGFAGGASYPATSAYTIGVGGVSFDGATTTAWIDAGSACSTVIAKQPWAPNDAPCAMRASADVSALADPNTGVAVYNAKQGKWQIIGGTSAAAPIVAGLFVGAGHGDARADFIYAHRDAFTDVTSGSTGTCGDPLCSAVTGWDGPTGAGTPDQARLAAIGNVAGAGPDIAIAFPKDGAQVAAKFSIEAAPGPTTAWIEIEVDGVRLARVGADPWLASTPASLAAGSHVITVVAYDEDHNSRVATATVTLGDAAPESSGCSASTGRRGMLGLIGIALVAIRRRRT